MNFSMKRQQFRPDGIFSTWYTPDGFRFSVSLEHAYQQPDGSWAPKLPVGTYVCQRGTHTLDNGETIETFEIMNVPGHTGMLIHPGNFDRDSDGCCCLGQSIAETGSVEMVTNSRVSFASFMKAETGVNQFTLTVS